MAKRGTIVLLHFAGQMPLAGIAWQAVNHLTALQKLGYDVWYVEDSGTPAYDPRIASVGPDCSYNIGYLRGVMERFGLGEHWAYWCGLDDTWHGLPRERVHGLYREADAIINLCGAQQLRDEHLRCDTRVLIDTDPGYQQINYAKGDPKERAYLGAHTDFFTYGANLGLPECPIPMSDIPWRPTRPPVDVDLWAPPQDRAEPLCFTTIASWDNSGKDIEYQGSTYFWSKHFNFMKFLDLPRRSPATRFRMAIEPPSDAIRHEVEGHGWELVDPWPISRTLDGYRDFITTSRAEFTVAKDIYARTNSGWFSDRTVCYLASGRPVVTMRTGSARAYPTGEGLFDFATHEEAIAAIEAIAGDYQRHSRAARELAREYFAADRVLAQLLAEVGL